ncbi:MAG: hypothetical protein M1834_003629 [Cirrosporium novae-zelandiae]|nr:MAG: hypothetical protein M1834_003629 [Cirrosporium novae-zelandiae]
MREGLSEGDAQITMPAKFVSEEAFKVHEGFGGSSQFDDQRAQFEHPRPYTNLELALKEYIPSNIGIKLSDCSWDALFDKVCNAETKYHDKDDSAREIFKNLWLKIGKNYEVINPWIDLIPDCYGLAVVKSGIAVTLKMAEKSAEKRQKILTTFKGIRDTLGAAKLKRKSFQTDPEVSKCATRLYFAVVDAIEELLRSLPTKKSLEWGRLIPRFKIKQQPENPDTVLERLKDSAEELARTVDKCRDKEILITRHLSEDTNTQVRIIRQDLKNTEINTRETNTNVVLIKDKVGKVHDFLRRGNLNIENIGADIKMQGKQNDEIIDLIREQRGRRREMANIQALMDDILKARNELLYLLCEDRKKKEVEIAQLNQCLNAERQHTGGTNRALTAVVHLDRLLVIIAQSVFTQSKIPGVESILLHPNDDLESILVQKGKFDIKSQGQAQSILQQVRFSIWMGQEHPDLLLVDGNIRSAALSNISAMSLFCANFVVSMAKLQPEEVLTHFFCGLHTSSTDPWYGPNGLVRSLIVQLLMALHERELLSLDFINSRTYLNSLEYHNLDDLCNALHRLVGQFPPEATVYCVVDSVSCFDKYLPESSQDLKPVISWLQYIVKDDSLRTKFKVLMTIPRISTKQLRQQVDDSQHITLNSSNLNSLTISNRSMEAGIPRPSTSPILRSRSYTDITEGDYDNDSDEW